MTKRDNSKFLISLAIYCFTWDYDLLTDTDLIFKTLKSAKICPITSSTIVSDADILEIKSK